jgi:hypothetical protein
MDTTRGVLSNTETITKASFFSLFRFATGFDCLLIVLGTLSAIGMGILQPLLFLFMSNFYNGMDTNSSVDDFYNNSITVIYFMIILGSIFMFLG